MILPAALLVLASACAPKDSGRPEDDRVSGGEARPSAPSGPAVAPWLVERSHELGLVFQHHAGASGRLDLPEVVGPGLALFDADGDGDLDVYVANGNDILRAEGSEATPRNRFFRQEDSGLFVDATAASGLGDAGYGMGLAVGDHDNDGDLDVYVANFGPDRLYRNRGDGSFEDVSAAAGIDLPGFSTSAAFFDADGDGWLDLIVLQYVDYSFKACVGPGGQPDYCGPLSHPPAADHLLRNRGDGSFVDASAESGIGALRAAGLGVAVEDLDGDGRVDLYVANDAYANHLWQNAGGGRFEELAVLHGAAFNAVGQAEAGMGLVAEDFDGDGWSDLFMTHLRIESNTLYRNLGGGRGFRDVTSRSGLGNSSLPFTGFGVAALDLELDGDLDLAVANGRVNRLAPTGPVEAPPPWDWLAEPNLIYLNDGAGSFTLGTGPELAAFTGPAEVSRALAAGDLDGDGDLDLVLTNAGGPLRVYVNEAPRRGHWLAVRAVDPRLNRDALGARVSVLAGGRRFVRTVRASSGYLTAQDPRLHFGLGEAETLEAIEVRWPDGLRERFPGGAVDRRVELRRGEGSALDG